MKALQSKPLLLLVLIGVLGLGASQAQGQTQLPGDVYSAVYEACSSTGNPSKAFDGFLYKIIGGSFESAMGEYRYERRSTEYKTLILNPDYERALTKCYGENETSKKKIFRMLVSLADTEGKIVAGLATLTAMKFVGAGISKLYGWSKVLGTTAGLYLSGLFVQDVWNAYTKKEDLKNNCEELYPGRGMGNCILQTMNKLEEKNRQNPASQFNAGIAVEYIDIQLAELNTELSAEKDLGRRNRIEKAIQSQQMLKAEYLNR